MHSCMPGIAGGLLLRSQLLRVWGGPAVVGWGGTVIARAAVSGWLLLQGLLELQSA